MNPYIFIDEYEEECREYFRKEITEGIMMNVFHPKNLHKLYELGFEDLSNDDDYE
jgi:hypothetical protein